MDVGEELFGRHGFDGISLREIAMAAGQANNAAVHYHFKGKQGLIGAILDDRVGRIEALRCERLARLDPGAQPDPRELLRMIWLPSMAMTGADGSHSFCRFLLQHMLQPGAVQHPIQVFQDATAKPGPAARKEVPCLAKALELLRAHCRNIPDKTFSRRLRSLSLMFLSSVVEDDNARLAAKSRANSAFDAEPILDMALAALAAPD